MRTRSRTTSPRGVDDAASLASSPDACEGRCVRHDLRTSRIRVFSRTGDAGRRPSPATATLGRALAFASLVLVALHASVAPASDRETGPAASPGATAAGGDGAVRGSGAGASEVAPEVAPRPSPVDAENGSPLVACAPEGSSPRPCAPGTRSPASVAAALSAASLDDSKGQRWNLAEIAAQPVLLILAGRKGSDQAVAWGEGIHRRHPGGLSLWATPADPSAVVVVSDADLHEVPGVLHGLVRWRIASVVADREKSGHLGPPLLLDWDGVIPRAVGADTSGDAIVVLLDRARAEQARFSGQPTEATLGELATAIDALRAPGGASKDVAR